MSTATVPIVRNVAALRAQVREWRAAGLGIALVPTMGALHEGHLSLIRAALARCDRVIVSIFVNPLQFGPNEDFQRYPRQEEADVAKAALAGTALVFAPDVAQMYAADASTTVTVGGVSEGLCGAVRPGHFAGVATVVTKLLLQALPDIAVFGEKDYQQLQVIKRLVRDLDVPVTILGAPTVRDPDGLAMSSRNVFLSKEQRAAALALPRALQALAARLSEDGRSVAAAVADGLARLRDAGLTVEYLEVRDAETLEPLESVTRSARALGAVRLGTTRLIDNVAVEPMPPR